MRLMLPEVIDPFIIRYLLFYDHQKTEMMRVVHFTVFQICLTETVLWYSI